jgi:hypothetical protein
VWEKGRKKKKNEIFFLSVTYTMLVTRLLKLDNRQLNILIITSLSSPSINILLAYQLT